MDARQVQLAEQLNQTSVCRSFCAASTGMVSCCTALVHIISRSTSGRTTHSASRVDSTAVVKTYSLVSYPPLTWQLTSATPTEATTSAAATAAANADAGASTNGRRLKQVGWPGPSGKVQEKGMHLDDTVGVGCPAGYLPRVISSMAQRCCKQLAPKALGSMWSSVHASEACVRQR
jgi:hypothetical protein